MKLAKLLLEYVVVSVRALIHPENVREWRMAWAFFVFPVFFIGGTALIVAVALAIVLPSPWDWIVVPCWLFYMLLCEPYMAYVEGDAFARWMYWVETGR